MKYAITGSTGALGTLVIKHLLALNVPAGSITAICRSPEKAAALAAGGLVIKTADYADPAALESALMGADRLMLISGNETGKRIRQHKNVINAAFRMGVKLLVYTSITRADSSSNILAEEHKATEYAIKSSGIPYIILRNNWYVGNFREQIMRAKFTGVIQAAAGDGCVASAPRNDYAEAAARVLVEFGHEGRIYELAGEPWNFHKLAEVLSDILGHAVAYKPVSAEEQMNYLLKAGLPEQTADFLVKLDTGIRDGTLDIKSDDLENLLGRKPERLEDSIVKMLARK